MSTLENAARAALQKRFRELCAEPVPAPASGASPSRHRRLFEVAREDVSLAKLVEAHWDALAILSEAGREPEPGATYAVWASEIPGQPLALEHAALSGMKAFCSGRSLVDRALVTVGGEDGRLLDVDLRHGHVEIAAVTWVTDAFALTDTGPVRFLALPLGENAQVGAKEFYLHRPGFWHGACGPAACWAGGACGLVDYAEQSSRRDPHSLAHLGAMQAARWALLALLRQAGEEMDAAPDDFAGAHRRALTLRHNVETIATDILQRFARAYGPYPLSMVEPVARRYHEVDLFLRQAHGERDLQALAEANATRSTCEDHKM